jgi:hypothetical protein
LIDLELQFCATSYVECTIGPRLADDTSARAKFLELRHARREQSSPPMRFLA